MNQYNTIKCIKSSDTGVSFTPYFDLRGRWWHDGCICEKRADRTHFEVDFVPPVCDCSDAMHAYTRLHVCSVCPRQVSKNTETRNWFGKTEINCIYIVLK